MVDVRKPPKLGIVGDDIAHQGGRCCRPWRCCPTLPDDVADVRLAKRAIVRRDHAPDVGSVTTAPTLNKAEAPGPPGSNACSLYLACLQPSRKEHRLGQHEKYPRRASTPPSYNSTDPIPKVNFDFPYKPFSATVGAHGLSRPRSLEQPPRVADQLAVDPLERTRAARASGGVRDAVGIVRLPVSGAASPPCARGGRPRRTPSFVSML